MKTIQLSFFSSMHAYSKIKLLMKFSFQILFHNVIMPDHDDEVVYEGPLISPNNKLYDNLGYFPVVFPKQTTTTTTTAAPAEMEEMEEMEDGPQPNPQVGPAVGPVVDPAQGPGFIIYSLIHYFSRLFCFGIYMHEIKCSFV